MNMSKKCARSQCGKTVYPLEELKCLDKVWHKQCFKCTVCSMALSMKNYKGYEKMPYCEAHYPKTVASVVSDTPEMMRLKENTKNQSLVQYHAEYEKMKGQMTNVSLEDPEIARHRKNMEVFSQAAYHHDADKKSMQEAVRPPLESTAPTEHRLPAGAQATPLAPVQSQVSPVSNARAPVKAVGKIDDYDPLNGQWGSTAQSPPLPFNQQSAAGNTIAQSAAAAPVAQQAPAPKSPTAPKANNTMRAMYDYTAADTDEVTFVEGDIIVGCQSVDEGWMTGTVQRTRQWGMLPANYVERVN